MPPESRSARPFLRLNGQAHPALSSLVRAMRVEETENGANQLELRLTNHVATADGGVGPAVDGDSPLKLGALVDVAMARAAAPVDIFNGKVYLIEHVYGMGSVPEVVVRAGDARQARRQQAGADVELVLGGLLMSARLIEGRSPLCLEGLSEGNPAIRVGSTVSVRGLSPRFHHRFHVSAATHLYDAAQGYRTEFIARGAFPETT